MFAMNAAEKVPLVWTDELFDFLSEEPAVFMQNALGETWLKYQVDIFNDVFFNPIRFHSVRASNGVGKSFILARIILCWLIYYPKSIVVVTAPTRETLETTTFKELFIALEKDALRDNVWADFKQTSKPLQLTRDKSWFAIGRSSDKGVNLFGQHNEYLLFAIDEFSGINQDIIDAGLGYLTGAGCRMIGIGNPNATSGPFFNSHNSQRHIYNTHHINIFDTPEYTGEKVPKQVIREMNAKQFQKDMRAMYPGTTTYDNNGNPISDTNPIYSWRILGQFPEQAERAVISLAHLTAAQERTFTAKDADKTKFPLVISCDMARMGGDEIVIGEREGMKFRLQSITTKVDTMVTVGKIIAFAEKLQAKHKVPDKDIRIVLDSIGAESAFDRLAEVCRERGKTWVLDEFKGSQSPVLKENKKLMKNRRDESWFEFAKILDKLDLDTDERLATDLVSPEYDFTSDGLMKVELKAKTKKRIGRSPDRGDCAVMAFSPVRINRARALPTKW